MLRRPGISRIQAIILIAVVALVVGLSFSAIQKVRGAAAMMKCSNNLKQLAIGLKNYDWTMGSLPMLTDQGEKSSTGNGIVSVIYSLVPYLECRANAYGIGTEVSRYNGHSSIEYRMSGKGPPFDPPMIQHGGDANQYWPIFICPADTTAVKLRDIPMTLPNGSTGYYATGSYAANGMLPWGKSPLEKACLNGTANTVVFAERPQVCKTASGETIYNLWGVGFYSPHMPAFAALAPADSPESWNTGQIAPVRPLPDEGNADQIRVRIGRADAAPQSLDSLRPFQRSYDEPCDPRLPGTSHISGMPCAMADGSVRIFSHRTTSWVFWSACVPSVQNAEGK